MAKANSELPNISFEDCFDDYKEKKVVEEKVVKKGFADSPIGKILHAIKVTKNDSLLDDEELRRAFNPFLILRWLSMNEDYCEIVNDVNQLYGPMDDEMVFKLLLELIPKGKTFDKYLKAPNSILDEDVINIATYFEISCREARTYVKVMGNEWARSISHKTSNSFATSRVKPKRGKK